MATVNLDSTAVQLVHEVHRAGTALWWIVWLLVGIFVNTLNPIRTKEQR